MEDHSSLSLLKKLVRNQSVPARGEIAIALGRVKGGAETLVDLVEGSVQVAAPGDGRVVLSPGEEARWDREKKELTKKAVRDPNFLAWKTRRLTFRNTPLPQVLSTLEDTYHTHFHTTAGPAPSCHVTASFDKEPLDHVLETLSAILDISFEKTKEGYAVAGNGCRE